MPLRFPRPITALIATGTAAICVCLSAMPASADQVRNQEWWLGSLHITAAWGASQGSGVTVAVLSDGVAASNADLAGAVTTGAVPTRFPIAAGQYFGEQGTPIASLIAGRGHGPAGGAGIVGVAPKSRILSIAVTLPPDDPQLTQSSVAAAIPAAIATGIRYAVNHGATVIDLPIDAGQAASSGTAGATAAAGGSAAEQAAVGYALAHNVVLVAPAGDNQAAGDAPNYPAAYRGVIAVGAFNSAFSKPAWSSHQSYVALTGPGANVIAADNAGGYQAMNSTSAASAVVSGAVALIRSRYPGLTVAEVRQVLITTTSYRRAGGLANGSGYGAVNAARAMTAAASLAAPPGKRADAGALPREPPAAAPPPASQQSIGAQILRAAEISGALLLVLLLLIVGYAATGRRRPRRQPVIAAEWTHRHGQSRYPHGASDADRMLELFTAPAPAPSRVLDAPPRRNDWYGQPAVGGGRWPGGDRGVFAPAAGRDPDGLPGHQTGGRVADEPAASGVSDGGWLSHGPASRAVSRRASVSGAPPWEPAAAPDGELPWAAPPGRHAAADASGRDESAPDEPRPDPAHVGWAHGPERADPSQAMYATDLGYDSVGGAPSAPAPAGYRSATGSGAPLEFDSRPDYSFPPAPSVAQSGLPVRQPRASGPAGPAPLSPSGSLWEPVNREPGEPTGYQDHDYDTAGRPIFVWDPPPNGEPRQGSSGD